MQLYEKKPSFTKHSRTFTTVSTTVNVYFTFFTFEVFRQKTTDIIQNVVDIL